MVDTYHSPEKLYKYLLYNAETNTISEVTDKRFEDDIKTMTDYMETEYGVYFKWLNYNNY